MLGVLQDLNVFLDFENFFLSFFDVFGNLLFLFLQGLLVLLHQMYLKQVFFL